MKYTARDHAYIYGVAAQALMAQEPENGLSVLEECIKTYALQRGHRMGQTAEAFGDPKTMQTYLAYGEWAPAPGEMDIRIPEESPSAVWNVWKCPWCEEWKQENMMDVGKIYCQFADRELVHGFNPELELGLGTTQTGGDDYCYFKWNGADMTPEHKAENGEIAKKVGTVRLKPWIYHMGHIYKTMMQVMETRLGQEAVKTIWTQVDEKLANHFGEDLVELMHTGLLLDYWMTPSLRNPERLSELCPNV